MSPTAPGNSHGESVSLVQLMNMFPTEEAAREWFESIIWPDGRHCPKCGSSRTRQASHRKMPYWCSDCRSYFSVKTGTAMQASKVPLRKWAIAIYLTLTSLKSISSMKLHRDIEVSQPTAWLMMSRIREAWAEDGEGSRDGPVEVDESYFGGERKNKPLAKRRQLEGRRPVDMTAVVGVKCCEGNEVHAEVITRTDSETLQGFVCEHTEPGATVDTDEASAYKGLSPDYQHESVNHSVAGYVRDQAHSNGMELFWSRLKRAHDGTFHKMSPKLLNRYVNEFTGKHNIRDSGTLGQMRDSVARLVGRNLLHRNLIACNGLPSGSGA